MQFGAEFAAGERAVARCDALGVAPYSEVEGALVRRFLSPAHAAALSALRGWMVEAGMRVRLDAAANLIGRYEALRPGAPALMIGSHIDSVLDAGRYDGPLGVMLGIDCVETFARAGRRLDFALEVIAFGDEEGSRFPAAMGCSSAVAGTWDAAALEGCDGDGVSLADAYAAFGLAGTDPAAARRGPGEVLAFLEAHIEQGPVLEADGVALGVVGAIAAQARLAVRITGIAGHAGTTPMALRRDPVPAAAEAILAVERVCRAGAGLVGTVGRIAAAPGATNVIAAAAEFSIDVRAETACARDAAVAQIRGELDAIAARRGLELTIETTHLLPESPCDPALTARLEAAVRAIGLAPRRLPSGAGHDAMVMASLCPTAMLFIRCEGGVSHNPAEAVTPQDAALAARAMIAFVEASELAGRA